MDKKILVPAYCLLCLVISVFHLSVTLSQMTNLDFSKVKEFPDDNSKFDKKWPNVLKKSQAISPFPTMFSKDLYSTQVKTRLAWQMGN